MKEDPQCPPFLRAGELVSVSSAAGLRTSRGIRLQREHLKFQLRDIWFQHGEIPSLLSVRSGESHEKPGESLEVEIEIPQWPALPDWLPSDRPLGYVTQFPRDLDRLGVGQYQLGGLLEHFVLRGADLGLDDLAAESFCPRLASPAVRYHTLSARS